MQTFLKPHQRLSGLDPVCRPQESESVSSRFISHQLWWTSLNVNREIKISSKRKRERQEGDQDRLRPRRDRFLLGLITVSDLKCFSRPSVRRRPLFFPSPFFLSLIRNLILFFGLSHFVGGDGTGGAGCMPQGLTAILVPSGKSPSQISLAILCITAKHARSTS